MNRPTRNPAACSKKPHPANTLLPYYGSKAATTSLALPFRLTTAGLRGTRNCTGCGCSSKKVWRSAPPHIAQRILRRTRQLIKLLSIASAQLSHAIVALLASLTRSPATHSTIDIVRTVYFRSIARLQLEGSCPQTLINFAIEGDNQTLRNHSSSDRRV